MNAIAHSNAEARPATLRDWLVLGMALLLAWGMWRYVQSVLLPAERAHFEAIGQPVDIGDLYPRWHGARELLWHGRDPYSEEVSREIQSVYYGRPLDTAGADRGRDEQRFAYPVYVVFFLAPTLELSFAHAQIATRWTLAFLTAWSVLLWLRALGWRLPWVVKLTLIVLTLSSPALVQGLRLQQLALLVAFCLAACAALVVRGRLVLAGCFLAFATIKPQLAFFPVLLFLMWVVGDWTARRRFLSGFAGMMALLVGAGEAVLPGWIPKFIDGLVAYRHYVVLRSFFDLILGQRIGAIASLIILGGMIAACWRWRGVDAGDASFLPRLGFVLGVTVIALPLLPPFNQVLLLPALLVVLRRWSDLWARRGTVRFVCRLAAATAMAVWLSAGVIAGVNLLGIHARGILLPFFFSFGAVPAIVILVLGTFDGNLFRKQTISGIK